MNTESGNQKKNDDCRRAIKQGAQSRSNQEIEGTHSESLSGNQAAMKHDDQKGADEPDTI
jgi:hypothetical protein